jgi:pyruvate kinase
MMSKVALEAEKALPYDSILVEKREHMEHQTDDAIAYNSCQTAYQLNADLIVAFTESGSTAARVSKYRPRSTILALTPFHKTQLRLTLTWGVTPVTTLPVKDVNDFFRIVREEANKSPEIKGEGLVVLVAGLPIGVPGGTNMLRVMPV